MSVVRIVREPTPRAELASLAAQSFGDMVKAVVDPDEHGADWIEFDSMINVRPAQGNRSRDVEDPTVRDQIRRVVDRLVTE